VPVFALSNQEEDGAKVRDSEPTSPEYHDSSVWADQSGDSAVLSGSRAFKHF
jgi:hypothetical protein